MLLKMSLLANFDLYITLTGTRGRLEQPFHYHRRSTGRNKQSRNYGKRNEGALGRGKRKG